MYFRVCLSCCGLKACAMEGVGICMLLWAADLAYSAWDWKHEERALKDEEPLPHLQTRSLGKPPLTLEVCSPAAILGPASCALPWAYSNLIIIRLKQHVLYWLSTPCPQTETDELDLACRGPWPL